MKYLTLIFLLIATQFSIGQNKNGKNIFTVERWKKAIVNHHDQIFEKRFYQDSLLTSIIIFNSKQQKDSITLFYNIDKLLIKQIEYPINNGIVSQEFNTIEYFYNDKKELIDVKSQFKTAQKYKLNYLDIKFKNPIGILDKEFSDIAIVLSNIENEPKREIKKIGLVKEMYAADFKLRNISINGIPIDSVLKGMNLYYTKDLTLLKDEFIFDKVKVIRSYYYEKKNVSKIIIELKFKDFSESKTEYIFLYHTLI